MRAFLSLVFACAGVLATAGVSFADAHGQARAQVDFGINVAQRGLWREAIYRWERAVELDPKYAAAYNDLAIAYEHEGQLDKARKAYEKALELDPTYAAAYNDLAIAYEHEGQLDKARKAYEKAMELAPNNAQIRQNYELFKEINDRTSSGKDK